MVVRGRLSHWSGGVIVAGLAVALCAGIFVTASSAARSSPAHHNAEIVARRAAAARALAAQKAVLVAGVTILPAAGATNVPLDTPIVVTSARGPLRAASVVSTNGTELAGSLASSRRWVAARPLAPNTVYVVSATAMLKGVRATATASFRTLTPSGYVTASIFPSEGMTVGVGEPVVVRFPTPITSGMARAAVLSHISVRESKPVAGGWLWFSSTELHFRPALPWPAGEKVTVHANLDGWSAGGGTWGFGAQLVHFSVGDAHVSIANLAIDQMTVTDNGRVIATYPISGGRPSLPTMNGIHIVMDRESVVRMISSSNGVPVNSPDGYDELVYDDVHISDSGEYVHAAPWSVGAQGHTNVSHGCINLSPQNAAAFMAFSRVGDIVQVVGSPRPAVGGDHGVMDWDTVWTAWTHVPAFVPPKSPPPPPPVVRAR